MLKTPSHPNAYHGMVSAKSGGGGRGRKQREEAQERQGKVIRTRHSYHRSVRSAPQVVPSFTPVRSRLPPRTAHTAKIAKRIPRREEYRREKVYEKRHSGLPVEER